MLTIDEVRQSRLAALTRGEKRYLGNPCLHGHEGWRSTRTATCIECNREKHQDYKGQRPGRGSYAKKGEDEPKAPAKLPISTPEGMRPLTLADLMAGSANRR